MRPRMAWRRARVAVVMLLLVVAGCATAAQRQAQQAGVASREAVAQLKSCLSAVWSKPEYASLVPHNPDMDTGQHTMVQLTDESVPSAEEARLEAARFDENSGCRKQFLASLSLARPDLVPILANGYSRGAAIVVELVERKITWGEAARRETEAASDVRSQVATADQRWLVDLRAENQAELARRQAAAEALMQWSQQQQMINAINRPVVTNCSGWGGSVNCVSR